MSNKRQREDLQNIHTRVPRRDYKKIQEICDRLGITQAEYFNSLIQESGYYKLLLYARRINKIPRPCRLDVSPEAHKEIVALTRALNAQASQIRSIGVNVSALIRDVRTGKVRDSDAVKLLGAEKRVLDAALAETHQNNARLSDVLYSEEMISKREIVYLNSLGEEVWKEVQPCMLGSSQRETSNEVSATL